MRARLSLLFGCIALSGCAGGGAGPIGIGAIVGDRNLAEAEPIFSKAETKCLDSADQLISIAFGKTDLQPTKTVAAASDRCQQVRAAFQMILPQRKLTEAGLRTTEYTETQRNEIMDAMIAASNRKCSRYVAFLKNADGAANAGLSLGSIITGGLGAIVGGPATAKALSGTAAILAGSRAAINEVYLNNLTIHVLAAAFEKARERKRDEITNLQACPVNHYTLMRGMEDAFNYHGSCSLVAGLKETALSVERSDNPGVPIMRKTLTEYGMLVRQAAEIEAGGSPTPIAAPSAPITLDALVSINGDLKEARQASIDQDKAKQNAALQLENARKALAEATSETRASAVASVATLQNSYDLEVEKLKTAGWKRDILDRDLKAAVQTLAGKMPLSEPTASAETRRCPYSAASE